MNLEHVTFWLGESDGLARILHNQAALRAIPTQDLVRLYDGDSGAEKPFNGYGYMLSMYDNVAVIRIQGDLVAFEHPYNRYYGEVSYEEIRNALIAAVDAGATSAMLDIASHGGDANGINELSDFVKELDKGGFPVYSYTGTNMLSGGYWLGSIGREIFANKMAYVGSIGVISVHMSQKKMLDERGISATVFRAGEFKALGTPFENLDAKATKDIQGRLDGIYDLFLAHVSAHRDISVEMLKQRSAEGRVFLGEQAEAVGLVDGILSFDKALKRVSEKTKSSRPNSLQFKSTNDRSTLSMKRVLNAKGLAAVSAGLAEAEALKDISLTDEVTETAQGQGGDQGTGTPSPTPAPAPAPAPAPGPAPAPSPAPANVTGDIGLTALVGQLTDMSGQLAVAKAEAATAKAEVETMKVTHNSLKKIAIAHIGVMQVALGGRAIPMDDMDAETVLKTHQSTNSEFHSRFKAGQKSEAAVTTDQGAAPSVGNYQPNASAVSLGGK